jgi:alkylation response protein AidB-like acyl-CoA dehydrogenase
VLNGVKHLVTLAPLADVALVFAVTNPAAGKWGISGFLVERGTPGFSAAPMQHKMGLRTVPIGRLHFEECVVPERSRLGPEGAGVSISNHSLEVERCCILASQLGAMERQLARAVAHARTRRQFGQPIGKFQSVSNRIADMKLRIETARLLLYKVAWLVERGRPAMLEAALLKLYLSEAFVASGLDAVRIHGGEGYLSEGGVERDLRDAIGGVLYAGTSDIQRNIVARLLGV